MKHYFSIDDKNIISGTTTPRDITMVFKKRGAVASQYLYSFAFGYTTGEYDPSKMGSIERIADMLDAAVYWVYDNFNNVILCDVMDADITSHVRFMPCSHQDLYYTAALIKSYVNSTPELNDGGFIRYTSISFSPIII